MFNNNNRIVEIDLNRVQNQVIDISTPEAAAQRIRNPVTRNFAVKSREVLIVDEVPANAVTLVD